MREKNFDLQEEEFLELVNELKNGNEALFKRIFLKQFDSALKQLIYKYRISREAAYDVAMDTMIYFRKLLIADKIEYGNLSYLFNKIASQIYLKQIEKNKKIKTTDDLPEDVTLPTDTNSELLDLLSIGWKKLGTDCQVILKHFYYNGLKLYQIAEILDRKPDAIRKQKTRCVQKLRSNIIQYNTPSYE